MQYLLVIQREARVRLSIEALGYGANGRGSESPLSQPSTENSRCQPSSGCQTFFESGNVQD